MDRAKVHMHFFPESRTLESVSDGAKLTYDTLNVRVATVSSRALAGGHVIDGTADSSRGTFIPCAWIHACAGETVAGQVGRAVLVVMADRNKTHCGGK